MRTIKIRVNGTVQGVFFRKFVKDNADELGIRGFVRNLEDGDVEIVAEGKDEKVNDFAGIIKNGTAQSEVKKVNIEEIKYQGFDRFKILRI